MDKKYLLAGEVSERLTYRQVRPTDRDLWLPFFLDPESTRYWEGIPDDPEIACDEQFGRIFERYEKGLGGMNALSLKIDGTFIGLCGLLVQWVDGIRELEIGYSILPAFRRQGFALEAASRCRQYAFEHQLATSLISIIHTANLPSQRVAIRNGMQREKSSWYKNNPVYIYRIENSPNFLSS